MPSPYPLATSTANLAADSTSSKWHAPVAHPATGCSVVIATPTTGAFVEVAG